MSYVVITLLLAVIFGLDGSHRLSSPLYRRIYQKRRDIQTNCGNLHVDGSPQCGVFRRNHPMALRCRRAGAVHHTKNCRAILWEARLLCPRKPPRSFATERALHLRANQFEGALMVDNPVWEICERAACRIGSRIRGSRLQS